MIVIKKLKIEKRESKSAMTRFQTLIGNDTKFLTLPTGKSAAKLILFYGVV